MRWTKKTYLQLQFQCKTGIRPGPLRCCGSVDGSWRCTSDQPPPTSGTTTERKKMIGEKNKYNIYTLLFSTFTGDSAVQMISPDAGKRCHRNFIRLEDRRSMADAGCKCLKNTSLLRHCEGRVRGNRSKTSSS